MESQNPEHTYALVDNRKRVAVEKLRDPFKEPEIAAALHIARTVTHTPIPREVMTEIAIN